MRFLLVSLFMLLLLISCDEQGQAAKRQSPVAIISKIVSDTTFDFESCEEGALPAAWATAFTGMGEFTLWKVKKEGTNQVLAQLSSEQPGYHFNLAVYTEKEMKNVELSVDMKAVSGKKDQGGGLVWRYLDRNNYYVVRANPLEDNVVLYKVKDGKRTDLPVIGEGRTYGVQVNSLGMDWNLLKVVVKDDVFEVYLNGEKLFQVRDTTFMDAGKIALWTKADAVTYFDNLQIKTLK